MTTGRTLLYVLGGTAVAGGVAYWLASRSSGPSAAQTQAAVDATPCENAAKMAALRQFGPYTYWAAKCRAQGGSPPPFPS